MILLLDTDSTDDKPKEKNRITPRCVQLGGFNLYHMF